MSEPRLISPMLDNFVMGSPISAHHGVCCCPAMENVTDQKYIIKIVSLPATPSQLDALLLSGAYSDEEAALAYFKDIADSVTNEVDTLEKLSEMEGFLPYTACQTVAKDSGRGYDVYLLSPYRRTLEKYFKKHSMTHLDALNLGMDLCAALSVCRRMGYLYVDLKPSNVFITGDRLYRIGDLGFINMGSLRYASLPERYLSAYTPPEIRDAYSALNDTMDIYAAGLILYQAYNNGELPFRDGVSPGDSIQPPLYADYEMSEIILKACAPNPEDRWANPMQMGQAIISYMQRNGASDTPIVPMPEPEQSNLDLSTHDVPQPGEVTPLEEVKDDTQDTQSQTLSALSESDASKDHAAPEDNVVSDLPSENPTEDCETVIEADPAFSEQSEEPPQSPDGNLEFTEDEFGNLSFLSDLSYDEEILDYDNSNYDSISVEVTEILNQADELAALSVPKPVVAPEYIDVQIPVSETDQIDEADTPETDDEADNDADLPEDNDEYDDTSIEETDSDYEDISDTEPPQKKKRHWLRNSILIIILFALLFGGYYYYKNYYLVPIEAIVLDGNQDTLTVLVKSPVDESLLTVLCSDAYGNQVSAPVKNGQAVFANLVPDTAYNIRVVSSGFHRLTGSTVSAYSTPIQSYIAQFDAITGSSDGSAILSFTVEGPDCAEWTVVYSADGEQERSATFNNHMVTITGLTVGKEYTFRLIPTKDLYLTGQQELVFTASKLIKAENLEIISCADKALTATWTAPEGIEVSSWSVRCYNDTFSETIITTDTHATFQNLDHTSGYTIEVRAIGMSVNEFVSIQPNTITAVNFSVDITDPTKLIFTWEPSIDIPADGLYLRYSIAGLNFEDVIACDRNTAVITPVVPNATYFVQIEDKLGNVLLGSKTEVTAADAIPFYWDFDGYDVSSSELFFSMCRTPDYPDWNRFYLDPSDYTTQFKLGEKASFLVYISKKYSASSEIVSTMYVIRNEDGAPIHVAITKATWMSMWYRNYCELDIPVMPSETGSYTIDVFFNGGLVTSQSFTIIE